MVQAGVYAGVLHYLKAVEGDEERRTAAASMAKMKEMPTDDPLFGKGIIRADGRKIHDMYLFEVKKPDESKGAVGLLQADRDDSRRPGLPAARRGRLPAGEELIARPADAGHGRRPLPVGWTVGRRDVDASWAFAPPRPCSASCCSG